MTPSGAALAAAAEALLGTPFRLRGRDPATGLDCVGLVAAALARAGGEPQPPSGYTLRQAGLGHRLAAAPASGFMETEGATKIGDLLLVRPGPGQHHLVIASSTGGFVHADAGLRRVVHSPAPLTWPVLRHWRLAE